MNLIPPAKNHITGLLSSSFSSRIKRISLCHMTLFVSSRFLQSAHAVDNNSSTQCNKPWLKGISTPLPLLSKTKVSSDTHIYTFSLTSSSSSSSIASSSSTDNSNETLDIPICSCILVSPASTTKPSTSTNDDSSPILTRPYTPISSRHQKGSFDLLVKSYKKGSMSQEFEKLKVGESMLFRQIPFNIKEQYPFGNPKTIIMLAAGTGITPMYQAIQRMLGPEETMKTIQQTRSKIILIYGCRTEKDILLRKELEDIQRNHPDRLEIKYTLSNAKRLRDHDDGKSDPSACTIHKGRLDKDKILQFCSEFIQSNIHKGSKANVQVWVCGPPSFYDSFCGPRSDSSLPNSCILSELGFKEEQVIKF